MIILPLTVVILVLGYFSITSYHSIKEYEDFLNKENEIVATELFDMAFAYHDLEVENEDVLKQLAASKEKITRVLDSVQNVSPSTQLLIGYRKQLRLLKQENQQILDLVKDLNAENEFLKVQTNYVSQELEYNKNKLETSKNDLEYNKNKAYNYQKRYAELNKSNTGLKEKLEEAAAIVVNNVSIDPIVRIKSNNNVVTTNKARRTKKLNVCFTVQKNTVTDKGTQTYYVQIIDPDNNVVGDQGSVKINNNDTLIVSRTVNVDYNNEAIDICEYIEPSENEKFAKGTYYVSIYNQDGLVENTSFNLK